MGIVAVPDPRLNVLSDLSKSQRVVPASLELVDIAGLVKGASQGEVKFHGLIFLVIMLLYTLSPIVYNLELKE